MGEVTPHKQYILHHGALVWKYDLEADIYTFIDDNFSPNTADLVRFRLHNNFNCPRYSLRNLDIASCDTMPHYQQLHYQERRSYPSSARNIIAVSALRSP